MGGGARVSHACREPYWADAGRCANTDCWRVCCLRRGEMKGTTVRGDAEVTQLEVTSVGGVPKGTRKTHQTFSEYQVQGRGRL